MDAWLIASRISSETIIIPVDRVRGAGYKVAGAAFLNFPSRLPGTSIKAIAKISDVIAPVGTQVTIRARRIVPKSRNSAMRVMGFCMSLRAG
jgi:hypothetical protein